MKRRAMTGNAPDISEGADAKGCDMNVASDDGSLSPPKYPKQIRPRAVDSGRRASVANARKHSGLPPLKPTGTSRPDRSILGFALVQNSGADPVAARVAKMLESYLDTVLDDDPIPARTGKPETECSTSRVDRVDTSMPSSASTSDAVTSVTESAEGPAASPSKDDPDAFRLFGDSPSGVMKLDPAARQGKSKSRTAVPGPSGADSSRSAAVAFGTEEAAGESHVRKRRRKGEGSAGPMASCDSDGKMSIQLNNSSGSLAAESSGSLIQESSGSMQQDSSSRGSSSESDDDAVERAKIASVVVSFEP